MNLPVLTKVRRHIGNRLPRRIAGERRAAVSIILFGDKDDTQFVIIERANRGRNAGQWALPGGKLEEGESALDAAIREAQEEVDLPVSGVEVLGELDDFVTVTGFTITPFVFVAPPAWKPRAIADEVQSVHCLEVATLSSEDVVHWFTQPNGSSLLQMWLREDMHMHAPTGAILLQFRELALFGRDIDVSALTQPVWTHQ
ncbi:MULTISPECIES: CoA pyrophosphatase [Microbacterium]|uniref:NUDIX hydrolase n=1 Tax=Microbacterium TaxID=33882 RepID=UPI000D65EA2E|nr:MULTISPECIES: CoA pyrophosphatase [Microbacterium]